MTPALLPFHTVNGRSPLLGLLRQAQPDDPAAEFSRLRSAMADADQPAATLRRVAWLYALLGDIAGAEFCLRRARLAPDDRGESWFAAGLLRMANEDADGAREAFVAAARARWPSGERRRRVHDELRGYDAAKNRFAALLIFDETFDSAFYCFLLLCRVRPGERQAYEYCVARALNHLGHSPATAAILEHDRAINGETIWYHANAGHFAWLSGRRDAADDHYRRAREIAIRDGLRPYHFNSGALVWLSEAECAPLLTDSYPPREPPLSSQWSTRFGAPCPTPPEIVLVVGCDGNYFRFFPKFLLSVLRAQGVSGQGRQVAVHCHLADPQPGQVEFLEWTADRLGAGQPHLKLSFGVSASAHGRPAFYTCLRFLALPDIMDWYGTGVLAMDIDSELDPAFFHQLDAIRRHDAGFRMHSWSRETGRQISGRPWSIGAHPTYLSPTALGRRFAAFMVAYIQATYDPTLVTNWTIDQCAIARAYDLIVRPLTKTDAAAVSVLNFAFHPAISRLPGADKIAFLNEAGGVTRDHFATLAETAGAIRAAS